MNAHLHLDDDLASYLNEQARQEQTTLDVVLNRMLRRMLPGKAAGSAPAPVVRLKASLVKDAQTGRMVLTRDTSLPAITTEMVNDILNDVA